MSVSSTRKNFSASMAITSLAHLSTLLVELPQIQSLTPGRRNQIRAPGHMIHEGG
jgi:hypothetical protein